MQTRNLYGDVHLHRPIAAPWPTPRQLPMDVLSFVGRTAELSELDALYLRAVAKPGTVPILTLSGPAGAGKSALALRWAHRMQDMFPDGHLYADLRKPKCAITSFLRAFDIPEERVPDEPDDRAALFRSVLNRKRVLILLDNAADAEQVQPLLPAWPGCAALVTSRKDLTLLWRDNGAAGLTLSRRCATRTETARPGPPTPTSGMRVDIVHPAGDLRTLPPELWTSAEVREAVEHDAPGAVVAVARRAHGLKQAELAAMARLSRSTVTRLEAGGARGYDLRVLRVLQKLLGIPSHLLGLAEQTLMVGADYAQQLLDNADAGKLPCTASTVAFDGPTLVSLCATGALGTTSATTIEHLRVLRRVINDANNWGRFGTMQPAVQDLCDYTDQLRHQASGELRSRLLEVSATYAEFHGWMFEETSRNDAAVLWTTKSLQRAQAADSPDSVAYAYVRMSHLAALDQDGDRVLGLVRAAKEVPGISPLLHAVALRQEAAGLADRGDTSCFRKLDEAQTLLDHWTHDQTGAYRVGYCLTTRYLELQRAECWLALGHARKALTHYEQFRWTGICNWAQGVHIAKLAVAQAAAGDLDHSAALADRALELAIATGSATITRQLDKLRPSAAVPVVAEVIDRLDQHGPFPARA